jgi:hypothetical protein
LDCPWTTLGWLAGIVQGRSREEVKKYNVESKDMEGKVVKCRDVESVEDEEL